MFESLTDRFEGIFTKLRGKGKLSEADVDEVLREIRLALLEADVNLSVVKTLQGRIRERAVGEELSGALNPAQQVVKIVNEELTATLGGEAIRISFASKPPTVVLMAGLQGSGKTTNSAKLARWFKAQGRNPMLVGADLQRPAAVAQLRTLAAQVDVPVYSAPDDVVASGVGDPVAVAAGALAEARRTGRDVMIVDTAGRLAIDAELMGQVRRISDEVSPDYTFLVVDAMTGQDAVGVAESFHQTLELDGVILTKLDGDARGGAALSVKEVVGRPIAFASTGEKLDDFELFHPDRLAGRILGMGDMLTLIEKAEAVYETEEAEVAAERMMAGTFTLDDFLDQLAAIKKMGPLQNLVGMMPGMPKEIRDVELEDSHLARVEAIIHSMNRAERNEPDIVDGSRRARIAKGSGTSPGEVSQLLSQFGEMRKMMQSMGDGFSKQKARKMKKNKKKVRKKSGGRTTPKGSNAPKIPAGAFQLPQLDERGNPVGGGLPEGFPGLG
ncbi:signal recognition particle protein [Candidatus Microthrix sp.]|uniref:signal recognition particle protein n=1 Tax=Candidatus Neomicrothrix sp. TaxID=2719034 RepID=UPI0025940C45|nr:signal recognition particle protein [Candidatus Microthrix sp.]HMS46677.1 signal recognition particle protein [Candidatus Microthrix sp.]